MTAPVPAVPDVWGRAVKVGAAAIFDEEGPESIDDDGAEALAEVALRAALPVLLADLADRIEAESREVEPPWHNAPEHERGRQLGLGYAARLVRALRNDVLASEVSRG